MSDKPDGKQKSEGKISFARVVIIRICIVIAIAGLTFGIHGTLAARRAANQSTSVDGQGASPTVQGTSTSE